jgi:hypothetical protein
MATPSHARRKPDSGHISQVSIYRTHACTWSAAIIIGWLVAVSLSLSLSLSLSPCASCVSIAFFFFFSFYLPKAEKPRFFFGTG